MPKKIIPSFFVTGTDTGVGKTFTSAVLLKALTEKYPVKYIKPVETGTAEGGDDCGCIKDLVKTEFPRKVMRKFKIPASPHLAAAVEKKNISLPALTRSVLNELSGSACIVEGAGGILVPLNKKNDIADLMVSLKLPVILTARAGLGTLNHTLLSAEALKKRKLKLAAIVLNQSNSGNLHRIEKDNQKVLRSKLGCPVVFLPEVNSGNIKAVSRKITREINLW